MKATHSTSVTTIDSMTEPRLPASRARAAERTPEESRWGTPAGTLRPPKGTFMPSHARPPGRPRGDRSPDHPGNEVRDTGDDRAEQGDAPGPGRLEGALGVDHHDAESGALSPKVFPNDGPEDRRRSSDL